jgi:hypothetical protein
MQQPSSAAAITADDSQMITTVTVHLAERPTRKVLNRLKKLDTETLIQRIDTTKSRATELTAKLVRARKELQDLETAKYQIDHPEAANEHAASLKRASASKQKKQRSSSNNKPAAEEEEDEDASSKKRAAPADAVDEPDTAKKQKVKASKPKAPKPDAEAGGEASKPKKSTKKKVADESAMIDIDLSDNVLQAAKSEDEEED